MPIVRRFSIRLARLVQPVPGEAEPDIAVGALLVQRDEAGG